MRGLLTIRHQDASATRYLDINPDEQQHNLYHVFYQNVPASLEPGDETLLKEKLRPLQDEYDYILIDTPPGKAALAFNGIVAADMLLVPASAERMSIDGVSDLVNHVQEIFWHKFRGMLARLRDAG